MSSAAWPDEVERLGLASVSFVGDQLAVPTTGLAVRTDILAERGDAVASLVRAQRRALQAIHAGDPAVAAVLGELAGGALHDVVRRCFSPDGTIPSGEAELAIELVGAELGVEAPPKAGAVYDFAALA